MDRVFDGKKNLKLGTDKNPAEVWVQNKTRAKEVSTIFEKNGWVYTVNVDPKKPEDINDLELLQNPPETVVSEKKVGRNEPCPCGSGKKYKQCHGR